MNSSINRRYTLLKKAVEVFHTYGINLTGPRKNDHFLQKLNMDPVFVDGLIFELEYQLNHELQDDMLHQASTPRELIGLFVEHPQYA